FGGFAYVDLLRPEVTKSFLETTYEPYKARYGDRFGTTIPAIFTDEPTISGSWSTGREEASPYSHWLAAEFEKRNGYSLKEHLPCLFVNASGEQIGVDPQKVRYDYYCTLRELWVDNFVRPISEWCEQNGIAWTGHYLEHHWPFASGMLAAPAVMSLYEYMQWPAIDMLLTHLLKDQPTDPLMLTIREAQSVANQLDRKRVLCEAYGAGGWDSTFSDYKRIGDWLMVHGISFMNQHLTYSSIVGARKRDHPQSFDWRQPWWDEYTALNDYHGRLSYALSEGKTVNRILVLHPTTAAFLVAPRDEDGDLFRGRVSKNPDMQPYVHLLQWLSDEQWDFDLGDEFIMERHGRVDGGKIVVGTRVYDAVIVPDTMVHMKGSTVQLLGECLEAGGRVVSLGEPSSRVDGLPSDDVRLLAARPNWTRVDSLRELADYLDHVAPRRLQWLEEVGKGVAHLRREWDDGSTVYFIVNSRAEWIRSTLQIEGVHVEKWDAFTGNVEEIPYSRHDAPEGGDKDQDKSRANDRSTDKTSDRRVGVKVTVRVELPPSGSMLLRVIEHDASRGAATSATASGSAMVGTNAPEAAPRESGGRRAELATGALTVQAEDDNVLVVDYCDLQIGNQTHVGIHTLRACGLVFLHHGLPSNPWDNTVQYKRRIVDGHHVNVDSGFTVSYRFRVAQGQLPARLLVSVERAHGYELTVNGAPVQWREDAGWMDRHIGTADILALTHEGENTLALTARAFDVLREVEPIFLRGAFRLVAEGNDWVLHRPLELTVGSWRKHGYPFYGRAMRYKKTVHVPANHGMVVVRLRDWEGTVASVHVNGVRAGLIGVGTGDEVDITPYVGSGDQEVVVRVCGSLKNLLGPHHDRSRPRRTAWPDMWKRAPQTGPPPAGLYDVIDYGMNEDFLVEEIR
ncbi:MAG: glycosyl hydrolase, partial [Sulfobacillus sp.]